MSNPRGLLGPKSRIELEQSKGMYSLAAVVRFIYGRLRIRRGLGRVVMTLAKRLGKWHLVPTTMVDGRVLYLDLREPMSMPYYLTGKIWGEDGESAFVRSFVRPGETAVDIGANVGWYSTLLSELVGVRGRVYAFEPNPRANRMLTASAKAYSQLLTSECAVGSCPGEANLYFPLDAAMGSLRVSSETVHTHRCRVTSLDEFFGDHGRSEPTLIKCDAEGAELEILQGSRRLLASSRPPLWVLEMSSWTAARFGYSPKDIVTFLKSFPSARYLGYHLDSVDGQLKPMPSCYSFRFNAVFVPGWLASRIQRAPVCTN